MEIVISVIAVALAFVCLVTLLISGARDRRALRHRKAQLAKAGQHNDQAL